MKYELISSERSPFGRICRMFMMKHAIPFDFRILNFVDSAEEARILSEISPINKVPILVIDGSQKIFDSRVIINYLMRTYDIPNPSIDEENIISAIYSCLDVSVTLFLMKHNGYDLNVTNNYLTRQKERIPRNLEFIKSWAEGLDAKNSDDWNYASMSLVSFLYWGHHRARTIDLQHYPHFQNVLDTFSKAPEFSATGW